MDAANFALLRRVADSQLRRLRDSLASLAPNERGSSYAAFVELHLKAIESLIAATAEEYEPGDDAEREILGHRLLRMKLWLDEIHSDVFDHRQDVGRRDLPVGLLHLIDTLVEDLLRTTGDPVVHSDARYMYSTVRLAERWKPFSHQLAVIWDEAPEPIVFNLPGLDPANALLAPILAHEVGHSVCDSTDLLDQLDRSLDESVVNSLKRDYVDADPEADIESALAQFGRWAEELICDALATELVGPSMLFASACFLPASAAGLTGDDHPDPAHRILLTLNQLESLGWQPFLNSRCPNVFQWLNATTKTSPRTSLPRDTFLKELSLIALPPIAQIARAYVGDSKTLAFQSFDRVREEVFSLVNEGVPPAEVARSALPPWVITAASWFHGITIHGDDPSGLAMTCDDAALSRFCLKTVEMSRVLQLWTAQ